LLWREEKCLAEKPEGFRFGDPVPGRGLGRALKDRSYLEFCNWITARLLAKATLSGNQMFWVQAEHRVRPDLLVAQTGYMKGAAGIGTFLFKMDEASRDGRGKIVFPDTPFDD
jgi:hypothetical protein